MKENQADAYNSLVESKLHTYKNFPNGYQTQICSARIGFKIYQKYHTDTSNNTKIEQ